MKRDVRRFLCFLPPLPALVAAFVATLFTFPAGPLLASDSERDARARYRSGVEHYGQARYGAALAEFEQAYALRPTPGLLFNLGQAHYQLGHYAHALRSLQTYLATARNVAPERRADVLEQLQDLRSKTGRLSILAAVAGALVSIDGVGIAVTPLDEPLLVNAGRHRVAVTHAGHVTAVHDVLVPGGGASSLSVWLVPLPRPPERHLETAAWISAGGLGALALASAIVTVVQRRRYEDARDAPWGGAPASGQQRLQDARGRVRGWALATDLLAAASLASCGAALYARWQSASEREPPLAGTGVPPSASLSALVQTRMEF